MRLLLMTLSCAFLFAACGGQNGNAKSADKKADSTVSAAAKEDSMTAEELEAAGTKSDDYNKRPPLTDPPKAILSFIPKRYEITDTVAGDLNKDAYPDMMVVAVNEEEALLSAGSDTTIKRKLFLFTGNADGSYSLAAQTDNTVYCFTCGGMMGDPLQRLTVKNGYFSLEYYGGSRERWTRITTFKYSPTDSTWLLHKDSHSSFDAISDEPDGKENTKTKIYSTKEFGRITLDSFDVEKYYDWQK